MVLGNCSRLSAVLLAVLLCLSAIAEPEAVQLPAMSQPAYPDDEPVIGETVAERAADRLGNR